MTMLNHLRGAAFWSLDALKGGGIRRAYKTLKALEAVDSDSEYALTYREKAISELLHHATQTTKYYQGKTWTALQDFPVIDRNLLNDRKPDFLSRTFEGKKCYTMARAPMSPVS